MYGYFGAGKLTDGDAPSGWVDAGNQGYVDVPAPPPPPAGQAGSASDWLNPYSSSPPLVAVDTGSTSPTSPSQWFSIGQKAVTGLVDIFGRPVSPPPMVQAQHGMPLWGWVAIGVGGVVVLGIAARALKGGRRRSYAGHKRSRR